MVFRTRGVAALAAAVAIVAAFAAPAPASAASTYADASTGNDGNDCLTSASACLTIAAALSKSDPGDTTFVADGTYAESLTLDQGKSLQSLDSTDPKPVIDNGSDPNPAITIDSGGAGTVSGFRIRSDYQPMTVLGDVTIEDNVFDEDNVPTSSGGDVSLGNVNGAVIRDNVFDDPDASGPQFGVVAQSSPTQATISDNTFSGFAAGVLSGIGELQISDNDFSGAHPIGSTPMGDFPGAGVFVLNSNPTITGNTFAAGSGHPTVGVYIVTPQPPATPLPTGATLSHNQVSGNDVGVQVVDSTLPVTLSNDLIHGNTTGIDSTDSSADAPLSTQGDVSATNETIVNNAVDASVNYTTLALDSSIISVPIDLVGGNGACNITYSDGPSVPSANGCGAFETNAAPQFVDPSSGDYHLQAGSPLIDLGDPASPGLGATDFYGGAREIQGKACSTVRRDIGANEYDPASTPVCPPPPPSPSPPSPSSAEPPQLKIDKAPAKQTISPTATFRFSSDDPDATFLCKIDDKGFRPCTSPATYKGLKPGKHRFQVVAVSSDGQRGTTRTVKFKVKKRR